MPSEETAVALRGRGELKRRPDGSIKLGLKGQHGSQEAELKEGVGSGEKRGSGRKPIFGEQMWGTKIQM